MPSRLDGRSGDGAALASEQPADQLFDPTAGAVVVWPRALDVAIGLTAFVVQVLVVNEYHDAVVRVCSGAQATVLALLLTRYVRCRPARLPWIELIYAVHYVQFGLAAVADPQPVGLAAMVPREESYDVAAILALASGLTMVAAFALARRATTRLNANLLFPRFDALTLDRGSRLHVVLGGIFVLLSGFTGAIQAVPSAANIGAVLFSQSPLLVVATVAFLARPRRVTALQLLGALVALGLTMVASSMLNDALVPVLVLGFLWWTVRRTVPILPAAVIVALMLILSPVKHFYRTFHWIEHPESGIVESWQYAFSEASAESKSGYVKHSDGAQTTLDRLGELGTMAYVVEVVPGSVPHTGGEIYPKMLAAVVPRLLWPEKPAMTKYALDPFVIALGLTDPQITQTSTLGITLTAQGYLEHGIPGSIGWMALLGLTLALLSRYFGPTLAGTLAGATMMAPLAVQIGGGFFNIFGGLWQHVAGATALIWLLWFFGAGYSRRPRGVEPTRSETVRQRTGHGTTG